MPIQVDDQALFSVFEKYCSFGNRQTPSSNNAQAAPFNKRKSSPITAALLDGTRFAKLAREVGLIDNDRIDLIEIDILFNRVKDKGERKISFLQFRMALKLLAEKKYQGSGLMAEEAEERVLNMVRSLGGPMLTAGITLPEQTPLMERLMEASPTYISMSPRDEAKPWKDDLRRTSSGSVVSSGGGSRRESLPKSPIAISAAILADRRLSTGLNKPAQQSHLQQQQIFELQPQIFQLQHQSTDQQLEGKISPSEPQYHVTLNEKNFGDSGICESFQASGSIEHVIDQVQTISVGDKVD